MSRTPHASSARAGLPLLALSVAPGAALAEGTDQLGLQDLVKDTVVFVDILDPAESILFTGQGIVSVTGPDGRMLGSFSSGEEIDTDGDVGAFQLTFSQTQRVSWNLEVLNRSDNGGRVYSYQWWMDAEDWGEDAAFDGSFFALVGGGGDGYDGVVEFKAEGLAGYQWQMSANRRGVDGEDAGRSVPENLHSVQPEYPIYLLPPSIATYAVMAPEVSNLAFTLDEGPCAAVSPGFAGGSFTFDSNVEGTYHLVCDLDGNGVYDLSTNDDLALSGDAFPGVNEVVWDGMDNAGDPVVTGTYSCQVTLAVGEFHFVAADVETSFPGFRIYAITPGGNQTPLAMRWNDMLVQEEDVPMPNGQYGIESSGPDGVMSGPYDDAASPNDGARSWGDFGELSKGNVSLLDTFSWLEASTSSLIDLDVVDGETDANSDGIPDACQYGYYHGGCAVPTGARPGVALAGLALLGLAAALRRRGA